MSRSHKIVIVFAALVSLFGCIFAPLDARAAKPTPASFTISPATLSLKVSADSPTQSATITITNQYTSDLHLSAELYGIDEGAVRIVPTGKPAAAVTSAVDLSATELTIPAHGYQTLMVTVTDSTELSDGGHYATLVLSEQSEKAVNSVFHSAASIALFIIKDQNIRTNVQLVGSSMPHNLFTFPSSGTVTLKNLGNTHIVPRGSVSIYSGDTLVGKAIINTESQILFPTKQADYKVAFDRYGSLLLPHKLRVLTMYRIDGSDVQLMKESFFWYIPIIDLVGLAALGAAYYGVVRYRHKLARTLRSLFGKKRGRRSAAAIPPASVIDVTTKSTIEQIVIEAETQQAKLLDETEPITTHQPGESSVDAESETVVSIPKHINVVALEESTVQPEKPATLRQATSAAKTKASRPRTKQPKKTATKASAKTTKSKTSSPNVSKTTKVVNKSRSKQTS